MKRINEIVVVEGKTDSQLLKELYDVDTIETHGLGLDDKTLELIKEASKTRGVIVLTDPDYPGLRIRNQVEKYVQNCKHAFVDRKDAIGKKKLGIAEANKPEKKEAAPAPVKEAPKKEAVKKAIENVVTFSNQEESISWKEFLELDIIGDKKKRLKIYDLFHLGYGNAKTLFKRLNMVGISREMIEKELENEGYSD
jgi:ribonuclease M5